MATRASSKNGATSSRTATSRKNVRYGKTLSWILRHGAMKEGLHMYEDGYVDVEELLALRAFKSCTLEEIRCVVAEDGKERFSFLRNASGRLLIRANQGHSQSVANSIDPDKLLKRLQLSDVTHEILCIHGTNLTAWEPIKTTGLSKMKRQMIHCATGLPGESGIISGMRKSSLVLIYLDIHAALADGIQFYKSDNDVLLTPGVGDSGRIPIEYMKRVVRRDTGEQIYPVSYS